MRATARGAGGGGAGGLIEPVVELQVRVRDAGAAEESAVRVPVEGGIADEEGDDLGAGEAAGPGPGVGPVACQRRRAGAPGLHAVAAGSPDARHVIRQGNIPEPRFMIL